MASIQGIYIALFGRPADPLGLAFFNEATQDGADLTAIGDLAATAEYQDRFEGMSNAQVVTAIYQSLFGRAPELAGLEFFVNALNSGELNINNVAIAILDGAQGADADIVANKEAAADAFTAAIAADSDALAAYQGSNGIDAGVSFLSGITADEASIPDEAAVAAAVQALVNAGPGADATFVLTPGDDFADTSSSFRNDGKLESDFKFTSGNQAVTASSATLGAGDILMDGSTTDNDRLNVSVNGDINGISGAQVTNIETINLTLTKAENNFDLANYTGVKTVIAAGSVLKGSDLGLTGFADSGLSVVDFSGVTTSAGDVAYIDDANADQDITYTGNAGDDYVELGDGNNVINLGAGNNEADLGDGNNTVTGGAGADVITVGDGDNTIDAGNGINTVNAGDGDNTITTGSGVDSVTVGGGDNTISTGAGADTVVVNGDGDNTIETGDGADTITINGNGDNVITAGAGADTIDLAGAGENLVVINEGDTGNSAATIDTIDNFSTGADSITFEGLSKGTAANYDSVDLGGAGDFAAALAAANVEFVNNAGTSLYIFAFDDGAGDGYLFVDADFNGEADYAVKLLGGAAAGDFAFGDIVAA